MPHFVAFQLFSNVKKTFFFLFCSEIRFFSFSEQCRNLNFYVQGVLVLTRPIAISRVRREQRPTDQPTDRPTDQRTDRPTVRPTKRLIELRAHD